VRSSRKARGLFETDLVRVPVLTALAGHVVGPRGFAFILL